MQIARLLSPPAATFCSAVLPWLVSWALAQGHAVLNLVDWSGMIFNGLINALLPLALALAAAGYLYSAPGVSLRPPAGSMCRPIPGALERYRVPLLLGLLGVSLPAIAFATVSKTIVTIEKMADG